MHRLDSFLEVDFRKLASNVERLKSITQSREILFMIKADAYGHGLLETFKFSHNELKLDNFGVATLGEALAIDQLNTKSEIYIFSDLQLMSTQLYQSSKLIPVISDLEDLDVFLSHDNFKNTKLALKFNTGMNRLGLEFDELEKCIKMIKGSGRKVDHLMTHFASSYIPIKENDRTHKQFARFEMVKKGLIDSGVEVIKSSCANSGAIEQHFALEDIVRPGLMLYGPQSTFCKNRVWAGQAISTLRTKIIKKRFIKKGTPVGYGAHVCPHDGELIYLPIGYGDGILTNYSGIKIFVNNIEGKVLGRVNMDMIAVLFAPSQFEYNKNDEVTIWQSAQEIENIASQSKTVPYQVMTSISKRIQRRYIQ